MDVENVINNICKILHDPNFQETATKLISEVDKHLSEVKESGGFKFMSGGSAATHSRKTHGGAYIIRLNSFEKRRDSDVFKSASDLNMFARNLLIEVLQDHLWSKYKWTVTHARISRDNIQIKFNPSRDIWSCL